MPLTNDPYRPIFGSLADQKAANLADKYEQKKQAIDPTTPFQFDDFEGQGPVDNSNLIDVVQSSAIQGLGSLADMGKYASNQLLGTTFEDRQDTGWSSQDVADEMTGVSQRIRDEGGQHQQDVMTSLAAGNYGDAALSAAKASPYTAADSAGTLMEVLGGTALTAATGGLAAPAVIAKKGADVARTAKKAKDAYDEATRLGKVMKKAKNLPAASAKLVGQGSLLAADLTMQSRDEYMKANNGEEPSAARMATMALTNMATSMFEPLIMAKLFVPSFKTEVVKEIKNLTANLGKGSNLFNIIKRVADGSKKIAAAGGAEGAQEYLQTWQQGLVANISPEQADDLWNSLQEYVGDDKNQLEALAGGLMGIGAGGVVRGVTAAPAVASGTTVDLTKAAAKGTVKTGQAVAKVAGKYAQNQVVKAADKLYSPEERADAQAEYKNRKAAVDSTKAEMEAQAVKTENAQSYDEIMKDQDLRQSAVKAQKELGYDSEDLKNPRKLKQLKDKIVRNNRGAQEALDVKLAATTAAKIAAKLGSNIKEGTVQAAKDLADTDQAKLLIKQTKAATNATKTVVKESVSAIREIRSSAALGLVEIAISGSDKAIRDGIKKAEKLEYSELKKTASAVAAHNPEFAKQLRRIAAKKRRLLMKGGLKTDDVINEDTLSPAITETINNGKIRSQDAVGVVGEIRNALKGSIADKNTLGKIKAALDIYEKSSAFTQQKPGSMSPADIDVMKDKIAKNEKRLGRSPTVENLKESVEDFADTVNPKVKKFRRGVRKKYIQAQKKIRDFKRSNKGQEIRDKLDNVLTRLDESAEDYADKVDQAINNLQKGTEPEPKTPKQEENAAKLKQLEELFLKDEEGLNYGLNNVEAISKVAEKAGYTDIDQFIKDYPGFGQNDTFYGKLSSYLPTAAEPDRNVVMNPDDQIDPESDLDQDDGYATRVFKKLLGCPIK